MSDHTHDTDGIEEPILNVDGLTVRYGHKLALDDLTFSVSAGEVLGLLGPNGAGKTTLIKSICGQIKPTHGTVSVCGKPVIRGTENRKSIGLVPQDIGLYGHMSAAENLDVFARIYGLPVDIRKRAISDAIETVGLTQRRNDRVATLSGGMKRRINYAAAILHNPALLILDEPTAGVDVPARDSIHTVTKKLTVSGMAVILVSHEMDSIEQICDRTLMLVGGKKHGLETPEALLRQNFGHQNYCYIAFDYPSESLSKQLKKIGFIPTDNTDTWRLALEGNQPSTIADVTKTLHKAKITPKSLTFRKPTLSDLMHQIESQARASL